MSNTKKLGVIARNTCILVSALMALNMVSAVAEDNTFLACAFLILSGMYALNASRAHKLMKASEDEQTKAS